MPLEKMYSGQSRKADASRVRGVSRRSFLAAGLAAPIIVPRHVLGGPDNQAPSDTPTTRMRTD